jgi:antigen flippase
MGRVISWPLGFVMLALGKGNWFLLTEITFNILHVALVALGLHVIGIEGVAIGFFLTYVGYGFAVYRVCRHLIDFSWSAECTRLTLISLPVLGITFAASRLLPSRLAFLLGISITLIAGVLCVRGLVARVGSEHQMVRAIAKLPGGKLFLSSR